MDIGAIIKELRTAKGLSQQQLATILGVKQNTLSRYESNITEPNLKTLGLLADIFEVSVDYLLGRVDF